MKKFELKQGDLYAGDHEICKTFEDKNLPNFFKQVFLDEKIDQFFQSNPKFKEYIDLYGKINNLSRYALLAAHGDDNRGRWVYYNKEKEYSVQSWINKVDGKYSGIFLCTCNPSNHTPKSKKSILVVPDSDVDFTGIHTRRNTIFSLLVPKIGEIDSYTIFYELEQLKSQINNF